MKSNMEIQTLLEQYQSYYDQRLLEQEPCWNDAVFRMETEQQWLDTKVDGITYREIVDAMLLQQSWEAWLDVLQNHLDQGKTCLLYLTHFCAQQSSGRTLDLLAQYLSEELFYWDWDAPCNQEKIQEMERFAEAIQLMECVFPEEFSRLCLQWIPKVPLENEYIPEMLLKGLVHTKEDVLPEILQDEAFHNGIKIGLLNYICESPVRCEAIFTFLKTAFKQNQDPEEKHFLGILLGEYGDSRGIPVLRKYLESLLRTASTQRQALQEIASAIYKLGGQYEDLMHI